MCCIICCPRLAFTHLRWCTRKRGYCPKPWLLSQAVLGDAPPAAAPPLLFKDKLQRVKTEMGIASSAMAHEAIAQANQQLAIAPSGTASEQLDKILAELS